MPRNTKRSRNRGAGSFLRKIQVFLRPTIDGGEAPEILAYDFGTVSSPGILNRDYGTFLVPLLTDDLGGII